MTWLCSCASTCKRAAHLAVRITAWYCSSDTTPWLRMQALLKGHAVPRFWSRLREAVKQHAHARNDATGEGISAGESHTKLGDALQGALQVRS